jgi:hypothetical protein
MTRIVAVNAPTHGHRAIAVWTRKIHPQPNLVNPRLEGVSQQAIEGIIALAVP